LASSNETFKFDNIVVGSIIYAVAFISIMSMNLELHSSYLQTAFKFIENQHIFKKVLDNFSESLIIVKDDTTFTF